MWQRVLYILLLCSSLSAQGFLYSYIDPCNQILVRDNYNIQNQDGGFYVTYYNKSKFFTLQQVLNGELESWAERVYNDFEDLFPCAVRVAEEILSSVLASNATEQFNKSDAHCCYDNSRPAKKQNQVISASGVFFKTFEGSDWLVSSSYAKSLVKKNAEVIVLTASYGSVSDNGFGNFSVLYGLRTPVEFGSFKMTFTNYVSYTLLRYYEGLNSGKQYLLLQSPIMLMPTLSFDFQLSQAFKVNLGFSMGYNTVVNDYGERTTTYSILFGTYF